MPTPTYTLIDSVTTTAVAGSVTFSGVSPDYNDLAIVAEITANQYDSWLGLRFNGDTGSNYNDVEVYNTQSTSTASGTEIQLYGRLSDDSTCLFLINVFDYKATNKHKSLLARSNTPTGTRQTVGMYAGRWANTSAVTSITLFGGQGLELAIGATFYLYGIEA